MQKIKNYFLRHLWRAYRYTLSSSPLSKEKRILVVSTTGMGDMLWGVPAIESLRTFFSGCYLAVWTSVVGSEVLRENPWIDRVYVYPRASRRSLVKERFDWVLVFHASQRSVLFRASLLGAARVVGTFGLCKGMDWILTDALEPALEHEAKRRLRMVEALGATPLASGPRVFLREEEKILLRGRWAALHPGAKEVFRRWPLEHFARVGRELRQTHEVLITGTDAERELMSRLAREIPGAHLLPKGASVRELAAWLDAMEVVVSNDTGPLHLAAALGRPVVGLYAATDPRRCGPYLARRAEIVAKPPTCMPCLRKQCHDPFCLLQIGVEEVLYGVKKCLVPAEVAAPTALAASDFMTASVPSGR